MGPLDLLALQKSVDGLQGDVVKLLEGLDALNSQTEERFNLVLKGSEATLDRLESLENKIEHSDVTVNAALSQVVSGLGERLDQVERDLDSRVDSGSVRLDKLEELDHEATGARVDVNRRLDLIEADVIDRAEETHKRITALVNTTGNALDSVRERVQVLTDRVAASNSQWGELYDRVGRIEGDISGLQDFQNEQRAQTEQLAKGVEGVLDALVVFHQSLDDERERLDRFDKLSEKRFTTSVELVDALRKDAGL